MKFVVHLGDAGQVCLHKVDTREAPALQARSELLDTDGQQGWGSAGGCDGLSHESSYCNAEYKHGEGGVRPFVLGCLVKQHYRSAGRPLILYPLG